MKKIIAIVMLMSASYGGQAGIISIGDLDFDESQFADALGETTGFIQTFETVGFGDYDVDVITPEIALTDKNINTGIFCETCTIEVLFTDNVAMNGAGDDLLIFEQGLLEPIDVIINGNRITYEVTDAVTNPTIVDIGVDELFSLYYLDLSDFGVADGDSISSVTLDLFFAPGNEFGSSDPMELIALNSAKVPEPSIIVLFAAGLFGIALTRRRMRS